MPELDDTNVLHSVEVQSYSTSQLPPLVLESFVDNHVGLGSIQCVVELTMMLGRPQLVVSPYVSIVCTDTCRSTWIKCYHSHSVLLSLSCGLSGWVNVPLA